MLKAKKEGRPVGRPRGPGPDLPTESDPAARLLAVIEVAVGAIEVEMARLSKPEFGKDHPPAEDVDRMIVLGAKASEIRGQVVRADAAVSRRRPTVAQVAKDIGVLTPDERAHVLERLGVGGGNGSVLS